MGGWVWWVKHTEFLLETLERLHVVLELGLSLVAQQFFRLAPKFQVGVVAAM
jgi:hypothetical protein